MKEIDCENGGLFFVSTYELLPMKPLRPQFANVFQGILFLHRLHSRHAALLELTNENALLSKRQKTKKGTDTSRFLFLF
ncbi:hypothetical protein D3C87_396070 [compost metagenome]